MITVRKWTGREVRALREARRLTIRELAALTGVTDRMISEWEAKGEAITPRPMNQEALDKILANSTLEAHERFARELGLSADIEDDGRSLLENKQIRHPVDGKLMALVTAGVYLAGENNEPRFLRAYYIDVFPTTNADYLRFVTATGYAAPDHWSDPKYSNGLKDHPVVFVTHQDAIAYATWARKTLPTTEQWEKAARGSVGKLYPWGDQPTVAKCNVRESGIGSTTPVERYHSGVSPYGVYDMCGNTWEWCSTAATDQRFELKGSAFTTSFHRCLPSAFNDADESMKDDDTGFRCAAPA